MGLFANTLFSILLGWVQTAASWLWGLVTNTDVNAWVAWVVDNWLAMVILLCIGGVATDFVVYLFRWQPYRVWGSFLRRWRQQHEPPEPEAQQPVLQRQWLYADGTTQVEDVPVPQAPAEQEPSEQLNTPIRPVRRAVRRAAPEQAYHQPVYPPQWQQTSPDEQGEHL